MVEKRTVYRLLAGDPVKKSPLGRPKHMWLVNITMEIGEVVWGDVD
jgi:hypothetical protein